MDFGQFPTAIDWAKKHIWLTVVVILLGLVAYGTYSFIGSYASKVGEETAGQNYAKLKSTVAHYVEIERILQAFIPRYNISRIGIARFHNTIRDIGNNGLFYFSFESVIAAPGVTADLLSRVPAVVIASVLPDLFANRPVFLWTRELDAGSQKEILANRGIKAIEYLPINDLSGRLIGMLTVSWMVEQDVPKKSERDKMIRELTEIAARIGAFLDAKPKLHD